MSVEVQKPKTDVWGELSVIHVQFDCDKNFDHTRVKEAYDNLNQEGLQNTPKEKGCYLLELAETSMLKAVELKRQIKHFEGQKKEYTEALERVKIMAEKTDSSPAAYYFLKIWYQFYTRKAIRKCAGKDETRYMMNALLIVSAQCIAYYRYLNATDQNTLI